VEPEYKRRVRAGRPFGYLSKGVRDQGSYPAQENLCVEPDRSGDTKRETVGRMLTMDVKALEVADLVNRFFVESPSFSVTDCSIDLFDDREACSAISIVQPF
jgi:hypothetical protein